MSARLGPPDGIMLASVLLLAGLSMVMVASASLSISEVRYGDPMHIVRRWAVYMPIGIGLMWAVSRIDISWWQASALPMLALMGVLMALVFVPDLGREINGARRWFSMFGMTVQPVEILKPVILIYMAHYMANFPERLSSFSSGLAPMLVALGLMDMLLLLQPDFGSVVLLSAVCMAMWFVGGVPMRHLLGTASIAVPLGAVIMVSEPYRWQRLTSFIDPWADPTGSGYQLIQSMIAYGSGGLQGAGLGQGVQKLFYLPEPFTDFISAVLAEELGLIGVMGLLIVFMLLLWRGMRLVYVAEQSFARLLSLGCVMMLGLSFIINMGAAMGMLPTKGMPMPILSYGGSALIGSFFLLGLLFSIQRHQPVNRRRGEAT
ncbi:MAG: putative lipid II flippase FtsW [Mariprofundaceae bacterium]